MEINKTSKLHTLHLNSYTTSPKVIVARGWTVLNCFKFNDKIEIVCGKVYLNNMRVQQWWTSALVACYRMDLIEETPKGKFQLTQLGLDALEVKEAIDNKIRIVKIADIPKLLEDNNKDQI